jgi:hypothetical protein
MLIKSGLNALPPGVRGEQKPPAPPKQGQIAPPNGNSNGGFASTVERLADAAVDTGFFAFNEVVEVGRNDPALALRYGATELSEKLLEGVGQNVRDGFGQAIIPTIRLAVLGANVYRANRTFKDPTAHLYQKGFDALRIATDMIGLAGSVLKYVLPGKAALGDTLVGFSYAADAVSHSVRMLTHGAQRVTVWKKALAERKASDRKQPQSGTPLPPAPAPGAPAPEVPVPGAPAVLFDSAV